MYRFPTHRVPAVPTAIFGVFLGVFFILGLPQPGRADDCAGLAKVVEAGATGFKSLVGAPLEQDRWASKVDLAGRGNCVVTAVDQALTFRCEGPHLKTKDAATTAAGQAKDFLRKCLQADWRVFLDDPDIGFSMSNDRLIASVNKLPSLDFDAAFKAIDAGDPPPDADAMSGWRVDITLFATASDQADTEPATPEPPEH